MMSNLKIFCSQEEILPSRLIYPNTTRTFQMELPITKYTSASSRLHFVFRWSKMKSLNIKLTILKIALWWYLVQCHLKEPLPTKHFYHTKGKPSSYSHHSTPPLRTIRTARWISVPIDLPTLHISHKYTSHSDHLCLASLADHISKALPSIARI